MVCLHWRYLFRLSVGRLCLSIYLFKDNTCSLSTKNRMTFHWLILCWLLWSNAWTVTTLFCIVTSRAVRKSVWYCVSVYNFHWILYKSAGGLRISKVWSYTAFKNLRYSGFFPSLPLKHFTLHFIVLAAIPPVLCQM